MRPGVYGNLEDTGKRGSGPRARSRFGRRACTGAGSLDTPLTAAQNHTRSSPGPDQLCFKAASNAVVAEEQTFRSPGSDGAVGPSKRLLRASSSGDRASGNRPGVEPPAYPSPPALTLVAPLLGAETQEEVEERPGKSGRVSPDK